MVMARSGYAAAPMAGRSTATAKNNQWIRFTAFSSGRGEVYRAAPSDREAPRLREVLLPVRRVDAVTTHVLSRRGRVDELAVPQVDADVRVLLAFLVEEQQVAAAQLRHAYRPGSRSLLVGVVGNLRARLAIAVLDQAAAIESGRGARAAEVVGPPEHLRRMARGPVCHIFGCRGGTGRLVLRCTRTRGEHKRQKG